MIEMEFNGNTSLADLEIFMRQRERAAGTIISFGIKSGGYNYVQFDENGLPIDHQAHPIELKPTVGGAPIAPAGFSLVHQADCLVLGAKQNLALFRK